MAKNYIQEGEVINWTNGTGTAVVSGEPVVFGTKQMGVALVNIANGATGSIALEGVFQFAKAAGVVVAGRRLWWAPATANVVVSPALNSIFIGFAHESQLTGDTTVKVQLMPFADEGPRILTLAATGAQTLSVNDFFCTNLTILVANTAAKTVTLPALASTPIGSILTVKKTGGGAFALTLDGNASETIGGGATFATIDADNDYAEFQSTSSTWQLLDSAIA